MITDTFPFLKRHASPWRFSQSQRLRRDSVVFFPKLLSCVSVKGRWIYELFSAPYLPAAERQPHPQQLLPAHVLLFIPATCWRLFERRGFSGPQPSHCPSHSSRAGQVSFHLWLYSQGGPPIQAECRSHYWLWSSISAGAVWISTGKDQSFTLQILVIYESRPPGDLVLTSLPLVHRPAQITHCLTVTADGMWSVEEKPSLQVDPVTPLNTTHVLQQRQFYFA